MLAFFHWQSIYFFILNLYKKPSLLPLFLILFFWFVKFFFSSEDFESWMLSFQDPSTIYAIASINLHDLTLWYVSLVLGIVCWCLYTALKNGYWRVSSKGYGLSRYFYFSSIFLIIESFFSFSWYKFAKDIHKKLAEFYSRESTVELLMHSALKLDFSFFVTIIYHFSGTKYFTKGVDYPFMYTSFKPTDVFSLLREKYLDFYLFNISTNGEFFYDDYTPCLKIRKFRHSFLFEIIWATFPTVIIGLILMPSLALLYSSEEELNPEFTLKVTGHQWFWSYEYSDFFNYAFGTFVSKEFKSFGFDSYLVLEQDLVIGSRRLLEVSNRVVLPTNIVIRFLITSGDVLHSWSVPEMGIKVDAVPGRLNECLGFLLRPGIFYGQCSELCGVAHGFMPIVVHAVAPKEFDWWVFWSI